MRFARTRVYMSFFARFLLPFLPAGRSPATRMTNDLLVFVIGATGTGKSKLAIEIASHLKGEVINADTLQVRSPAALFRSPCLPF